MNLTKYNIKTIKALCFICLLSLSNFVYPQVPQSQELYGLEISTAAEPYQAQTTITATNVDILSTGSATFEAGSSITLTPSFWAEEGSQFNGIINEDLLPIVIPYKFGNYIVSYKPRTEISSVGNYSNYEIDDIKINISYFDGLGRNCQNYAVGASPNKNDIIEVIEYDEYGREIKEYLPFSKQRFGEFLFNADYHQGQFYANPPSGVPSDNYPFSENIFEESPLGRVVSYFPEGEDWRANPTINNFALNSEQDAVMFWEINENGNYAYSDGSYPVNSLYMEEIIDENGNKVQIFKDAFKRKILKRIFESANNPYDTYYAYDIKGNLRFVIPPKAIVQMRELGWNTDNLVEDLVYWYNYDDKKRLVEKKIPGMDGPIYFVYNKLDQLVLIQDPKMRSNAQGAKWLYHKYDVLERQIITGILTEAPGTTSTREQMHTAVVNTQATYETRSTQEYGYTDIAFPNAGNTYVIAVNYYDDYDFDNDGTPDHNFLADSEFPENQASWKTNGKLTGEFSALLNQNKDKEVVNFYDDKGRVIQVWEKLDGYYQSRVNSQYDFSGSAVKDKQTLTNLTNNETTVIRKRYDHDHVGRLLRTYHQVNEEQEVLMCEKKYNAIGEVIEKNLHSTNNGNTFAQSVDYEYNIRGWLAKINEPSLSQSDDGDLFGMELKYSDVSGINSLNPVAQYNGNVAAMLWETTYNQGEKGYTFSYDGIDRLKSAFYAEKSGSFWQSSSNYNAFGIEYDEMGNITNLKRNGFVPSKNSYGEISGSYSLIDDLEYLYDGNRLKIVNDLSGNNDQGFFDANSTNTNNPEYLYDGNGNMYFDVNKQITVEYNYLNLPQQIAFSNGKSKDYLYDAAGNKIAKQLYDGINTTSKFYFNNFVYEEGSLDYIITDEGRITKNGSDYQYEYFLKDHLKNTRASFKVDGGSAVLLQENHYYPFGLEMGGLNFVSGQENKYLYNGKEKEDEFGLNWYDFGERMYDPTIARWNMIDAVVETNSDWSPYRFALNNPLKYNDPDGNIEYLTIVFVNEKTGETNRVSKITGSRVFTDGRVHHVPIGGQSYYNAMAWYDRQTTVTVTKGENGITVSEPKTKVLNEGAPRVTTTFPAMRSSAWANELANPTGFPFGKGGMQNGGFHFVTDGGGANPTKWQSLSKVETKNISVLLDIISVHNLWLKPSMGTKFGDIMSNIKTLVEDYNTAAEVRTKEAQKQKAADENMKGFPKQVYTISRVTEYGVTKSQRSYFFLPTKEDSIRKRKGKEDQTWYWDAHEEYTDDY